MNSPRGARRGAAVGRGGPRFSQRRARFSRRAALVVSLHRSDTLPITPGCAPFESSGALVVTPRLSAPSTWRSSSLRSAVVPLISHLPSPRLPPLSLVAGTVASRRCPPRSTSTPRRALPCPHAARPFSARCGGEAEERSGSQQIAPAQALTAHEPSSLPTATLRGIRLAIEIDCELLPKARRR